MIAAEEMDSLPPFAEQCCIVYIPEVGYLLAIKLWGSNLTDEDMILEGLEYKVSKINKLLKDMTISKERVIHALIFSFAVPI